MKSSTFISLLFHRAYEDFYRMAENSECFHQYCQCAFGADFSQDGFSDLSQIELILRQIPRTGCPHLLDIGCGNGRMLKYLQQQTGAHISGFDYSKTAIASARADHTANADFRTGTIGKIKYPPQSFDFVISMDSIYFAGDQTAFLAQVRTWMKDDGTLLIGYQEGDIMPKTANVETTVVAQALRKNNFVYEVENLTAACYEMLKRKRECILRFDKDFQNEGLERWFSIILNQTNCAACSLEEFQKNNARYLFTARKAECNIT